MPSDLVAFLSARLDETEAAARVWSSADPIWTPYVLAEIEAKRRILDLSDRDDNWRYGMHSEAINLVLRLLALPYADHPDYDESWRP